MASDISVSIGVDGESKFKQALKECQNSIKQIDSALKANAAEYEANAEALGDNAERTRLLQQSIDKQRKMMDSLGEAIEYASREYGEASKQTTEYVIAQNRMRESVAKLEKELKDTDREMEELGRDSIKVGRQIENGIGDAAEDAAKSLDEMYDQLMTSVDSIKSAMGFDIAMDVGGMVMDTFGAIDDFAEGTRDYRRMLSYVEQGAYSAGLDWGLVKDQVVEINTVTGDMEGSIEGIANLMRTGFDSSEIVDAVDLLAGAVIAFPETYKFESLAEGLRETVQQGEATGQFAELLEALGIDLDVVNEALAQATTLEERQDIVLSFLANHGLEQVYNGWRDTNEILIKATESDQNLQDSYAKWGELIDKYSPKIKDAFAAFLGDSATGVDAALTDWGRNAEEQGGIWKGYAAWLAEAWDKNIADPWDEWSKGFAQKMAEDIGKDWTAAVEEAKPWREMLADAGDSLMTSMFGALWTGEEYDVMDYFGLEPTQEEIGAAQLAGEERAGAMTEGMISGIEGAQAALETAMSNSMIAVANGVTDGGQNAYDNLTALVHSMQEQINSFSTQPMIDELNRLSGMILPTPMQMPTPGGTAVKTRETAGGTINLNINGRAFAKATIKDYNAVQGRTIELA